MYELKRDLDEKESKYNLAIDKIMDEIEQEEITKKKKERDVVENVEADEKQIINDIDKIQNYI